MSASRALRSASMTSMLVAAPARKLTLVMSTTCCAWLAAARALARLAFAARDRLARRPHLRAGLRGRARQRRLRLFDRRLALRLRCRPLTAVENRDVRLQQQPPAVLRQEELRRVHRRGLKDGVERWPPVFRAVANDAFGGLLLGGKQLQVGAQHRRASRWRRRSVAGAARMSVRRRHRQVHLRRAARPALPARDTARAVPSRRALRLSRTAVARAARSTGCRCHAVRARLPDRNALWPRRGRATLPSTTRRCDDDRQKRIRRRDARFGVSCRRRSAPRRSWHRPPARAGPRRRRRGSADRRSAMALI